MPYEKELDSQSSYLRTHRCVRACTCPDELKNGALFCKTAGHLKTKLPGGYVLLNGVIYLSIYDGVLYARHGEALIAYKIK